MIIIHGLEMKFKDGVITDAEIEYAEEDNDQPLVEALKNIHRAALNFGVAVAKAFESIQKYRLLASSLLTSSKS